MHTHRMQVDVKWTETYRFIVEAEHLDEASQEVADLIEAGKLLTDGVRQCDGTYEIIHVIALPAEGGGDA